MSPEEIQAEITKIEKEIEEIKEEKTIVQNDIQLLKNSLDAKDLANNETYRLLQSRLAGHEQDLMDLKKERSSLQTGILIKIDLVESTFAVDRQENDNTLSSSTYHSPQFLSVPPFAGFATTSVATTSSSKTSAANKKQLSPVTNQLNSDICRFIETISNLENKDTYLKISDNVKPVFSLFDNLLIRKSYEKLYNIISSMQEEKGQVKPFIVLGNPGIGMSFFGYYLVWKFLQDKQSFIYKPQENTFKEDQYMYCTFNSLTYNVRILDPTKEDTAPQVLENVWYVSDSFLPTGHYAYSCKRTVFLTSPKNLDVDSDTRRLSQLLKDPDVNRLFMPVWSKDELLTLCQCFYPSDEARKNRVLDLYSIFGGIARFCLSKATIQDAKKTMNRYVNNCNPIKRLESVYLRTEPHYPEISQGLLHFNIDPETCTFFDDNYAFKIASSFVITQLCKKYRDEFDAYAKKLIKYVTNNAFQNTEFSAYVGQISPFVVTTLSASAVTDDVII